MEEDRARLQKTANIQQTQIEKHRALAEESNRKGDGLQQQVTALQKVGVKDKTVITLILFLVSHFGNIKQHIL